MKRTLTQKLGQLGVLSFLSYTTAVVFAPLAYPGYNWMSVPQMRLPSRCGISSARFIMCARSCA